MLMAKIKLKYVLRTLWLMTAFRCEVIFLMWKIM